MQPRRSYLICATPFDGSALLCEALQSTGIAGYPQEYFGISEPATTVKQTGSPRCWHRADAARCLASAFEQGTSANGVFGARLSWSSFEPFVGTLRSLPTYARMPVCDLLPAVFPRLRYLWFTRRDTVRQAIARWKATQRALWDQAGVRSAQLEFNFAAVDRFVQEILAHERAWLRYFNACHMQPLVVTYEELLGDYEGTMQRVLAHLHLCPSERSVFARPALDQQSDAVIDVWCRRYAHIKLQTSAGAFDSERALARSTPRHAEGQR